MHKSRTTDWKTGISLWLWLMLLCMQGCSADPSKSYAELGMDALENKDFRSAANYLEKARDRDPENAVITYNLGSAYWNLGNIDAARKAFEHARTVDETDPRAPEWLGHIYMSEGDWPAAVQMFSKAIDNSSRTPRLLTALAIAERGNGETAMAKQHIEEALSNGKDPEYAPALYNLACLYRDEYDRPTEAMRHFKRFMQVDTRKGAQYERAHSEYQRLDALLSSGNNGNRVSETRRMITRARTALTLGNRELAINLMKQVVQKDPDNPDYLWQLATTYDQANQPEEAAATRERFRTQFPTDRRARHVTGSNNSDNSGGSSPPPSHASSSDSTEEIYTKAKRMLQQSRFDDAAVLLEKVVAQSPRHAEAMIQLGLAYKASNHASKAIEALKKALPLKPKDKNVHYALAEGLYDLQRYEDSISRLHKLLRIDPDYKRAYWLMSRIRRAQGNTALAKRYMDLYRDLGGR